MKKFRISYCYFLSLVWCAVPQPMDAQNSVPNDFVGKIIQRGMIDQEAFRMLSEMTATAGSRLSGSENFAKAVVWGKSTMEKYRFDRIWLEPVAVPHWVRHNDERASLQSRGSVRPLTVCALGGSIGTPAAGVTGQVIEVHSLAEVKELGARAKGKIIFYNRPFDRTKINTFEAYGGAVDQRGRGAIEAAKVGAAGVLVRSMTNALDDIPHTGAMNYADSVAKVPAAAVSTVGAEYLSSILKQDSAAVLTLRLNCETLPDVETSNVIGELIGSQKPDEIVLIGGHLDSWDKGVGAHDDGAGCVQSIEALRILKELGLKPKRTIRAVLFANEENGLRGGKAYAATRKTGTEKHIAAIESDAGGFSPRGFGFNVDSVQFEKIQSWSSLFESIGADKFHRGGGGADISPLDPKQTVLIGLIPDNQRYFDYHHSDNDTLDKVHPRELEIGAIALAILAWKIAEEGI